MYGLGGYKGVLTVLVILVGGRFCIGAYLTGPVCRLYGRWKPSVAIGGNTLTELDAGAGAGATAAVDEVDDVLTEIAVGTIATAKLLEGRAIVEEFDGLPMFIWVGGPSSPVILCIPAMMLGGNVPVMPVKEKRGE